MSPTASIFPLLYGGESSLLPLKHTRSTDASFKSQWRNPNDILSLLLILGPDVVGRALAQLAGSRITPVVFSFGWVAYAVNALVPAFGDGQLMPEPDYKVIVIGAKSGHVRSNQSWILGRLLRDFEDSMKVKPAKINKLAPDYEALRVSIFQVDKHHKPGVPTGDWVWYSGFVVGLIQIVISLVPLGINSNWAPVLITIGGNTLAFVHGGLTQWGEEKWACPTTGGWTASLTQGNGSRNVMVILGNNHGLDLEILAGKSLRTEYSTLTRVSLCVLSLFWILLLVSVSGLNTDTWYLLGLGSIGMIHNLVVAGIARDPSAFGIHLNQIDTIKDVTVSKVLQKTEDRYPLVGSSLVPIFFPGGMRVTKDEQEFWANATRNRESQGLSNLSIKVG